MLGGVRLPPCGKITKTIYGDVGVVVAFLTPFSVLINEKKTSAIFTVNICLQNKRHGFESRTSP